MMVSEFPYLMLVLLSVMPLVSITLQVFDSGREEGVLNFIKCHASHKYSALGV